MKYYLCECGYVSDTVGEFCPGCGRFDHWEEQEITDIDKQVLKEMEKAWQGHREKIAERLHDTLNDYS